MKHLSMNEKGFSLVELMIVVGIIGILATLAVPKFQQFQAKAKMTEAKNMLTQIHSLEESYFLDNNTYIGGAGNYGNANCAARPAWAQSIGFSITPCTDQTTRFYYGITAASATAFTATATSAKIVCPGDAANIVFNIDQNRAVTGSGGNSAAGGAPSACAN